MIWAGERGGQSRCRAHRPKAERHATEGTHCPEEGPEELTWDTPPLSLLFPCTPLPCQSLCWQPRKETHLRKQWAVERSQLELMRTAPQTCEPWDCRLACHGHWPASTSRPP